VIILPTGTRRSFAKVGKIVAGTMVRSFAPARDGVAGRRAKPDVSSAEAFQALAAGRQIHPDHRSRDRRHQRRHFMSVLERLGIAEEMKSKLVLHRVALPRRAHRQGRSPISPCKRSTSRCVPGAEFVPYGRVPAARKLPPAASARPQGRRRPATDNAPANLSFNSCAGRKQHPLIKAKCMQPG